MLCLTLHPGQRVGVGQDIVIMNCGRGRMRIGIEAPQEVAVVRENAKVKVPKEGSDDD